MGLQLREPSLVEVVPLGEKSEAERHRELLEDANAAYASLRRDPGTAADFDREIVSWEGTLTDGLGEPYPLN